MIIWRGLGFMVAVFVFLSSLVANLLANSATGDGEYWKRHGWPFASSLAVSAVLCGLIGVLLERGAARSAADARFAARIGIPLRNDFFFVPVKWWAPILAVIAFVVIVTGFVPG